MEQGKVTGANVSVRIDDEFMRCAESGEPYLQRFPVDSPDPAVTKETDARALWAKIVHNAWQSAEPGVLFWDTIRRESVPDCYADLGFETISTNPCGEIPLCPYASCRLVAINLYSYVRDPFTDHASFDFGLLGEHAAKAQRVMDDIIDLEMEKIDAIIEKIVMGGLAKYYKEICLMQQPFVKDDKVSVEDHVAAVAKQLGTTIKVNCYTRFEKGEGIEKRQDALAAEVAKLVK